MYDEKKILEVIINYIKQIYDPELPVNIYELGLIYDIKVQKNEYMYDCFITMTLTSTGCPVGDTLVEQVSSISSLIDELEHIYVNLVFDPPWDPQTMLSYETKLDLGLL